jgi:hypothetical protein
MPPPWRFRCYVTEDGTDEIRTWYEAQSKQVQQKFLGRLLVLRGLPPEDWRLPLFRWLRGNGQGLGEVRFKADRVQPAGPWFPRTRVGSLHLFVPGQGEE